METSHEHSLLSVVEVVLPTPSPSPADFTDESDKDELDKEEEGHDEVVIYRFTRNEKL